MARYIHPEVQQLADDPSPGETARVVLVLDVDAATIAERITERFDEVGIERTFTTAKMVLVRSPQERLTTLCELEDVAAVAPTDTMRSDV